MIKETAKALLGIEPDHAEEKAGLAQSTTFSSLEQKQLPHQRNVKEGDNLQDVVSKHIEQATFVSKMSLILSWLSSSVIVVGGILPYVPQYREINRTDNAEGFSTHVCLALLAANTLRILFWFGHPFEIPLLVQSVVMILTMFAMLELCVRVKQKNSIVPVKSRYFLDFEWHYFWKWTDFISYIECWATFTVIMGCLMYFLIQVPIFVELMGFAALLIEATLALPQFTFNYKKKSTKGMSVNMVLMWLIGDVYKTSYFVVRNAPIQFLVCGVVQVCLDLLILYQVYLYRKHPYHKLYQRKI